MGRKLCRSTEKDVAGTMDSSNDEFIWRGIHHDFILAIEKMEFCFGQS